MLFDGEIVKEIRSIQSKNNFQDFYGNFLILSMRYED